MLMICSMAFSPLLFCLITILFSCRVHVSAQNSTIYFPSNSSLTWINGNSTSMQTYEFSSNLIFHAILRTGASPELYGEASNSISFAFGFYCNRQYGDTCLLSVIILGLTEGIPRLDQPPEVIWHANRKHPVTDNATLSAEARRGLVLNASKSFEAWSTNITKNTLVSGMTLQSNGDLVLFSSNNNNLWHSFRQPSSTLVIGQELTRWQKLRSSRSVSEKTLGRFSLSVTASALTASEQSISYLYFPQRNFFKKEELRSVIYNGNNLTFVYKKRGKELLSYWKVKQLSPVQLLRLDWDGGVRYRYWNSVSGWSKSTDFTLGDYNKCLAPLCCGRYGFCVQGECSCPKASNGSDYFKLYDSVSPRQGCTFLDGTVPDLVTNSSKLQLVDFGNLSYYRYADPNAAIANITELGKCKQACEGSSFCKAAFFMFQSNTSEGLCYLPTEVLTIGDNPFKGDLHTIASIKVPIPSPPPPPSHVLLPSPPPSVQVTPNYNGDKFSRFSLRSATGKALAIVLSLVASVIVSCFVVYKIKRAGSCRRKDCFELVLGAPVRFSYKELSIATGKFSTRLGKGGFGTVFKGELKDGTVIAVKRLDCIEQGTGEFLAEMKTMGSIHHYNLVKLIGFCADESNRLLVYEYMSNGSLDKWIFSGKQALTWETRRKIILEVARGLAYLHEECSQRIAHLDMKPHNVLLDDNFNAKISDFGLARFIDRNQSQAVTAMRGTLGYLAPEWQTSRITVKADVYSFGVVILEAVSGRMNLDYSQMHLLGILQRKASEDRLIDIADKKIVELESHEEDIVKMIRIGAWCLNEDQSKRPDMSTVVKILDGTMEIDFDIDFKFAHVLIVSCPSNSECSSKLSSSSSSPGNSC